MIIRVCDLCKKQIRDDETSAHVHFQEPMPADGMPPLGIPLRHHYVGGVGVGVANAPLEMCEACAVERGLLKDDKKRKPALAGALTREEFDNLVKLEPR